MGKVYIDNWSGFRPISDLRKIGVFAEWNLNAQKVEFQSSKNSALDNEVIFEYKISAGETTGRARTTNYAAVHFDSNSLPLSTHKIIIKSYESSTLKDDLSMDTKDAPPL